MELSYFDPGFEEGGYYFFQNREVGVPKRRRAVGTRHCFNGTGGRGASCWFYNHELDLNAEKEGEIMI